MEIKIDKNVFLLRDTRVQQLASGRFSVAAFAHSLIPGDPFIMIGDTIYALAPQEYYALARIQLPDVLSKAQFDDMVSGKYAKVLPQAVNKRLAAIADASKECSKCKYNAYRQEVVGIIAANKDILDIPITTQMVLNAANYPELQAPIQPIVSGLFKRLFGQLKYDRKPCLDCVQKHISQAYITGNESLMGYPDHLMLCSGHLQQAFQECPADQIELRQSLLFCIAKTKKDMAPFVPIYSLTRLHDLSRKKQEGLPADNPNVPDESLALQYSAQDLSALSQLPVIVRMRLLTQAIETQNSLLRWKNKDNKSSRAAWIGCMASLADSILPYSPKIAGVIRNIRLFFKGQPLLTLATYYDCSLIIDALRGSMSSTPMAQSMDPIEQSEEQIDP